MTDTTQPLLGTVTSLAALFRFESAFATVDGRYALALRSFPLKGLPGCVSTEDRAIMAVTPNSEVFEVCVKRCLNGVIDHFRCIRSAALMADNLLPVFCSDGYGNSFLLAYVPYSEYNQFAGEGDR